MDKKKIEMIAVGVLVVVFIFVLANSIGKVKVKFKAAKAYAPVKTALPVTITPQIGTISTARKAMEKGLEKPLGWGRDPFMLQAISPEKIEDITSLKLMGITIGEKSRPMAIINNKLVSAGSSIGKFKVLSVSMDKVIVTDGAENFELRMQ